MIKTAGCESGIEKTVKIEGGKVEIVSGDEAEQGAVMPAVIGKGAAFCMEMAVAAEADIERFEEREDFFTVIGFCDGRIVKEDDFLPVAGR